ncbi:fasciclin domain-containing protein [Pedobacter nutrimenti]|uniref:Putative surface protein with fasciclin (FAS1) repeats n=1 Tax=Pedobacter nutrimenti TaxID=1241337 RepID=A0A318UJB8_9SPHI|nr:fasciclin domain-containing protein [Pedobacter nutrimenti]PYF75208.1 putative surface protein with fasciclin (FAS1) repeats [Pedobacter nutrimenti]
MMKNFKYTFLLLAIAASACKKDKVDQLKDNNKISAIVADNFNLSIYNTALVRTGLAKQVDQEGPFTAIAPSDDAFGLAGFKTTTDILSAAPARISAIMNYHILNGRYEFNKLPFLFNQEIKSANGGKLFVTHWVKGPDTILTINGSKILSKNVKASNGLIQVIDRVLEPYAYNYVSDAIASDRNLTLFYQALQRAGLLETLNGKGPYTVFAPDNAAMTAFGLNSVESINQMDPAVLLRLMRYHIIADRRFIYDYILSTGISGKSEQSMLDGNSVQIKLKPDPQIPGAFTSIELLGTGNTAMVQLGRRDQLTGNGVVHTITSMLKITQ